jgi:hypothetical protein
MSPTQVTSRPSKMSFSQYTIVSQYVERNGCSFNRQACSVAPSAQHARKTPVAQNLDMSLLLFAYMRDTSLFRCKAVRDLQMKKGKQRSTRGTMSVVEAVETARVSGSRAAQGPASEQSASADSCSSTARAAHVRMKRTLAQPWQGTSTSAVRGGNEHGSTALLERNFEVSAGD